MTTLCCLYWKFQHHDFRTHIETVVLIHLKARNALRAGIIRVVVKVHPAVIPVIWIECDADQSKFKVAPYINCRRLTHGFGVGRPYIKAAAATDDQNIAVRINFHRHRLLQIRR